MGYLGAFLGHRIHDRTRGEERRQGQGFSWWRPSMVGAQRAAWCGVQVLGMASLAQRLCTGIVATLLLTVPHALHGARLQCAPRLVHVVLALHLLWPKERFVFYF